VTPPPPKLKVKNSYIPWSFLDIIAADEGLFAKNGLDVEFFSVGKRESEPSDKVSWYSELITEKKLDTYSVCAWGAIDRLSADRRQKILAVSKSSSYAFSIVVAPGLGVRTAKDLADIPIAVNMRTGSHYCVLCDLERVLPYEKIKVVHAGEPQSRLKGLLEGKFQAVALISPYTEIAVRLGYMKVAETRTVDVLAFITRGDIDPRTMTKYIDSLNQAADQLTSNPESYRGLYLKTLKETFSGFPTRMRSNMDRVIDEIGPSVAITYWSELERYPKDSYEALSLWMDKHKLLESVVRYEEVILDQPLASIQGK
jgi:NitT/TauT family transport system substrate-binding protein